MTLLQELSPWVGREFSSATPDWNEKTALAACLALLSISDLFGVSVDSSNVGWSFGKTADNTFLCDTGFFGKNFPLITVSCARPQIVFKDMPWWFGNGISHGDLSTVGNNKTVWLRICFEWAKKGGAEKVKNLMDDSTWETITRLIEEPGLLKNWSFASFFALDTQPSLRDFVHRFLQNFPDAASFAPNPPTGIKFSAGPPIATESCILRGEKCADGAYDSSLKATLDEAVAKISSDECLFPSYKYPAEVFKETGYVPSSIDATDNAAAFYFAGLQQSGFNAEGLGSVLQKFWTVRRCTISWGRVCCWNYNCSRAKIPLYQPDMCKCENFDVNFLYPPTWTLGQTRFLQQRNKDGLMAIIRKLVFGFKGKTNDRKIDDALKTPNDMAVYGELRDHYTKRKVSEGDFDRGAFRVSEMENLGVFSSVPENPEILDFGGGQGEVATALARRFDVDKSSCYAIDVENWFGTKKIVRENSLITFVFTRSNLLPFADGKFSLITCLQVLHHLEDPMLTLSELHRVLAKDGIIVVREHEADSPVTRALIDVEHSLFEMVQKEPDFDYLQSYRATYFSRGELLSMMTTAGFKLQDANYSEPTGPTRYYYSVWRKA